MCEFCMHLDYDHMYISINFQIKKIPATKQHFFFVKNAYCCVGQNFWKTASIFPVWELATTGKQIERNFFCH